MFSKISPSDKIYIFLIFILFYLGDIITTFVNLNAGGYERNIIMAEMGFYYGTVLTKTIVFFMVIVIVIYINHTKYNHEWSKYNIEPMTLKGVLLGSTIAYGVMAILVNLGLMA